LDIKSTKWFSMAFWIF